MVALAVAHFRRAPTVALPARFDVPWPAAGATGSSHFFQLSPDGRYLAIVAEDALWVRRLDSLEPVRLERTQGTTYPFWSPDSKSIGFFAGGQLMTIPREGGPIQTICDAPDGRGGAWSPRGTILFSDRYGAQGLSRVAEQGGTPVSVTKVATSGPSDAHRYPQFLPDGERFLYLYLTGATDTAGVWVGSLSGAPAIRVLDGSDRALFAPSPTSDSEGYLLFRRQNTLMAQVFDAGGLKISGAAFAVATGVGNAGNTGHGAFSVAASGALAHTAEGILAEREIVWIDRSGKRQGTVTPHLNISDFALARDERRIAISVGNTDRTFVSDIWLQSLGGGSPSKFTFGPSPGWMFPVWSPKGDQIAYANFDVIGLPAYEIRRKASNMAGVEELLLRSDDVLWLWDWSPDGKTLVFANHGDLKLLPLEGERKPLLFAKTPGEDQYAQFSADGRWMAYASGDREQAEVYVQPIPATGPLWQISKGGGTMPRWGQDGKELFYRASDGRLMAVTVSGTGSGSGAFEFSTTTAGAVPDSVTGQYQSVHLSGVARRPALSGEGSDRRSRAADHARAELAGHAEAVSGRGGSWRSAAAGGCRWTGGERELNYLDRGIDASPGHAHDAVHHDLRHTPGARAHVRCVARRPAVSDDQELWGRDGDRAAAAGRRAELARERLVPTSSRARTAALTLDSVRRLR